MAHLVAHFFGADQIRVAHSGAFFLFQRIHEKTAINVRGKGWDPPLSATLRHSSKSDGANKQTDGAEVRSMTAYLKRLKAAHPVAGTADDPDRVCLACHDAVPNGAGVYRAHLRALAHQGDCSKFVDALERAPGKTARGTWRRPSQVFTFANGARCVRCSEAR